MGEYLKKGIINELDELRNISKTGKNILLKIQNNEIKKTGISSLKIAYNKIFGYYLEVTNAHKDKVPDEWIRKQTLVNSERYITEELKGYPDLFILPDTKINVPNYLITNFHAPMSSLLSIVQNVYGDNWKELYKYAIDKGLKFLSFGDAVLFEYK